MKTPLQSKQIWTGVAITLLGVLGILSEAWSMLTFKQIEALGQIFGPETMTIIGVVMVLLRVVTTSKLVLKPPNPKDKHQ